MVYILKDYYKKINKNIEQCQEAFLKIDKINEQGESKYLNQSVYILTNEKEEDRLLRENLELEDLEIQIDEVQKAELGYEGKGYESERGYESEDYESGSYKGDDYEGDDYEEDIN